MTRIAEGVHQAVWSTLGFRGAAPGRARGLTGFVYQRVHGLTLSTGRGVDAVLARLESEDALPDTPRRETLVAVLNGVLGDRLAEDDNPLALPMTLRLRGAPLDAETPVPEATGKIAVLIHGLCMSDGHWPRDGYQAALTALGYTPVYVRYNSGLHISQNGRALAAQLDRLVADWPVAVTDLTVVAHSMGGLLARSALHYAGREAQGWPAALRHIVFLGTPHHGAPLERAGNWVDTILARTAFTAPFAALGKVRSAGITDLRHGFLLDADWQGHDRFRRRPDARHIVPLPAGVACYAVAATRSADPRARRLLGDGLVPLPSALDDDRHRLGFAAQWIAYGTSHFDLLSDPAVIDQVAEWLMPAPG